MADDTNCRTGASPHTPLRPHDARACNAIERVTKVKGHGEEPDRLIPLFSLLSPPASLESSAARPPPRVSAPASRYGRPDVEPAGAHPLFSLDGRLLPES
ncbi:hypothetical protein MRX96_039062 [Rhipicephalus microplus]